MRPGNIPGAHEHRLMKRTKVNLGTYNTFQVLKSHTDNYFPVEKILLKG